eukprot:TRINITY_DN63673_c0_g1_i1.p1 TRINITY_DN63673_c0_g1~~TRINITY_DN63673_c0_g1_i1.p1  ORF type:complete len:253 (-),score=42.98 TRINITY_DN63673_c0_g1_i1:54-812(-)
MYLIILELVISCIFGILFFFFQAEDGIRDAQESRGLGDVYKRQVRRSTIAQGWSLSSNVEDSSIMNRCGSLASIDNSKGGLSTTVGVSPRVDQGPFGNLSTPCVISADPRRPSMSLARTFGTFGGAGQSFSSVGVIHQHAKTFSDVAARYVSVDTLIHEATVYTQQLANPTSGAGHRSFRREQEGRFATTSNNSLVSTGDAFDDETLVTSPNMSNTTPRPVSYTHLRAHETPEHLVCRLLLEKKKIRYQRYN